VLHFVCAGFVFFDRFLRLPEDYCEQLIIVILPVIIWRVLVVEYLIFLTLVHILLHVKLNVDIHIQPIPL
jgi:hypothetical protein